MWIYNLLKIALDYSKQQFSVLMGFAFIYFT